MMSNQVFSTPNTSNFSFTNSNFIHNNNNQMSHQQVPKINKIKALLAQCLAVLPIFLLNFSIASLSIFVNGYIYAFEPKSELMKYIYYISNAVGLLFGGILAQIRGGRLTIKVGMVALVGCWLIFKWGDSKYLLFTGLIMTGLTWGMIQSPSYVYLAEIAQPKTRDLLMATVYLSAVIGKQFAVYDVNSQSWTRLYWINMAILICGSIIISIVPESPYWLANKKRYERAESSLAWFRGWTNPINVKTESTEIINHALSTSSTLKLFTKNSLYISFLIVFFVFAVRAFSGIEYLVSYFNVINFKRDRLSILLSYCYNSPIILFVGIVAFVNKRILLLISLFFVSLSVILLIIFDRSIVDPDITLSYMPYIILLGIFFLNFGVQCSPLLLNGELFPSRLRYVGAGVGLLSLYVMENIVHLIYVKLLMNYRITHTNMLYIIGAVNLLGFFYVVAYFPKTTKKSMVEIEQSRNSIRNLR